jgi:hypothetical protein
VCSSPRGHCGVGGGRATSVDGKLPRRKKAAQKRALFGSVVVVLGQCQCHMSRHWSWPTQTVTSGLDGGR